MSNECRCGKTFMIAEDYRDHLPCPKALEDRQVTSGAGVRRVLDSLTFAKSCVDMGWAWDVEELFHKGDLTGFLIRTTFRRPDRDPPHAIKVGLGGWHHVPNPTTESAIVKRAFVACKAILEHELMEAFHWRGVRILDPHNTVQQLASIKWEHP